MVWPMNGTSIILSPSIQLNTSLCIYSISSKAVKLLSWSLLVSSILLPRPTLQICLPPLPLFVVHQSIHASFTKKSLVLNKCLRATCSIKNSQMMCRTWAGMTIAHLKLHARNHFLHPIS